MKVPYLCGVLMGCYGEAKQLPGQNNWIRLRKLDEQGQVAVATREALAETAEYSERVSGAAVRRR